MEKKHDTVSAGTLRNWLDNNEPVFVLDVRPPDQRAEWQIPGSHYVDAYKKLKEGDSSVLDTIEIPANSKVVTVCAAGRTSQIAANALRNKGVDAYSLEGGMKQWSTAWNKALVKFDDFTVIQIRRTGKGCLSYILISNKEAAIIDASLPADLYKEIVEKNNIAVRYVLETHIHADHLSRSKEIADLFKVDLFLPGPNKVRFPFNQIIEYLSFSIGTVKLQVIPTPGHTQESVSFYIDDKVLFTGDTLFTDGVGRPDLRSSEEETRKKAALLYDSLKRILSFPAKVMVLPAHASKPVAFDGKIVATTIGDAKNNIPVLKKNESEFVDYLLQRIPPSPANYLNIVERNLTSGFTENEAMDLEAGANRCAIS